MKNDWILRDFIAQNDVSRNLNFNLKAARGDPKPQSEATP